MQMQLVRVPLQCMILCMLAALTASLQVTKATAPTLDHYYQVDRDGRYIMRYATPNGIVHFETGYQRRTANGTPYQVKEGYYIYPTADGKKVRVSYFADHEGYRVLAFEIRETDFEEKELQKLVGETEEENSASR